MITFTVPGKPEPAGSKRAFAIKKGGVYTGRNIVVDANKNSRPWKDAVLAQAIIARGDRQPLDGPLQLDVTFTVLRPKGHYGTGKNAHTIKDSAPPYPTTKPDCTKLLRAVEDAMTGTIYHDDAQIVAQHVFKVYGPNQGAEITVAPYEPANF